MDSLSLAPSLTSLAWFIEYGSLGSIPLILIGLLIGSIMGSFASVVCHRLPIMLDWQKKPDYYPERFNLLIPRSLCQYCCKTIPFWHNIPLISYFILRHKCVHCKQNFSVQYPLIELSLALLCASLFLLSENILQALWLSSFALLAVIITIIDWRYLAIPDELNYSLLWLGLLYQTLQANAETAIYSAIIGYFCLYTINLLYSLIRKRQGIGQGDFKLFAAIAAWFGWFSLANILLYASLLGTTFALIHYFATKQSSFDKPIAFGPWLLLASYLQWLQGNLLPI